MSRPHQELGVTCGDCTSPLGWRTRVFWQLMWLRLHGNKIRFVLGEIKALRFTPWVHRAEGPCHGQDEAAVIPCTVLLPRFRYGTNNTLGDLSFRHTGFDAPRLLRRAIQARYGASERADESPNLHTGNIHDIHPRENHVCIHL